MRLYLLSYCLLLLFNCKEEVKVVPSNFSEAHIETILEDSILSIRAIEILNDKSLAFAANSNTYGLLDAKTNELKISRHNFDSIQVNFRAVGHTQEDFFMMSIGNPALLYKTTVFGMQLVYSEDHHKVFYDSIDFWNDQEGIAIGDPTDDCMSIIITRDGGETWQKLSCEKLPSTLDGEAAFAASDTNIAIVGNHTWVATGGISSRVLYSPDKGETWEVYDTPIVQGKSTTGMYSIDFYDENIGFAVGGDYTQPDDKLANKIKTMDGGKTWEVVGINEEPGYRSCVQYVPNGQGKALVLVGFNGVDFSNDGGLSWTHLSDEGFYTIRFLDENTAYAAGKGRLAKLTFK